MKISIIIPCYQEIKYIEECLKSVVESDFDFQGTNSEILVVDGMSDDGTRDLIKKFEEKYPFIKMVDNVETFQVFGLNIAIKRAKGDLIIRLDAHCEFPENYFSELVKYHKENDVSNVGGCVDTFPGSETKTAHAISAAMTHFFGMGNSSFRISKNGQAKEVDTVPFGCWKRKVFDDVGFFDEVFIRHQDYEHNFRIKKNGGNIVLLPWVRIKYYARESWRKAFKMFFQYGYWKNVFYRKHKTIPTLRQLIPVTFVLSFLLSGLASLFFKPALILFLLILFLYLVPLLSFSFLLSNKNKKYGIKLFFYNVVSFIIIHFSYGLGTIRGFWDVFILRKKVFDKSLRKATR